MKKLASIICTALLCVSALPALANTESGDHQKHGKGRHHTPPAEAIAACKGLSAKDICQFNGRDNNLVAGVCVTPRARKADPDHSDNADKVNETATLVCRPKRDDPKRDDKTSPQETPTAN